MKQMQGLPDSPLLLTALVSMLQDKERRARPGHFPAEDIILPLTKSNSARASYLDGVTPRPRYSSVGVWTCGIKAGV